MTGGPVPHPVDGGLSHLDERGAARMVDVSGKASTLRSATAIGTVFTTAKVLAHMAENGVAKGDVLATARIAAIQAAKRTGELIPLCHQVPLSSVKVDFVTTHSSVELTVTARTTDRTGVEMEALTAVTVGALTIYDMIKALDPAARIEGVRLLRKEGGKAGVWEAPR